MWNHGADTRQRACALTVHVSPGYVHTSGDSVSWDWCRSNTRKLLLVCLASGHWSPTSAASRGSLCDNPGIKLSGACSLKSCHTHWLKRSGHVATPDVQACRTLPTAQSYSVRISFRPPHSESIQDVTFSVLMFNVYLMLTQTALFDIEWHDSYGGRSTLFSRLCIICRLSLHGWNIAGITQQIMRNE